MENGGLKKVCLVVSSVMTVKSFLLDQIRKLSRKYEVCVVANTDDESFLRKLGIAVEVIPAPIERKISIWRDITALCFLARIFRSRRFDVVHSVSPKAGLLSMLAGKLARIPFRIHMFTGQVWVTRKGLGRLILKHVDKLLASLATHVLVDSRSQRDFLLGENVIPAGKSEVLAKGSISGVDTSRFRPSPEARAEIRCKENIPGVATVFLYLGRLNRDKGVIDLAGAFSKVCLEHEHVHLLIVGPDEGNLAPQIRELCSTFETRLHMVDYTNFPERYMACADVFCLPSYREGFGSVIIEAASSGIPAIATRIYGVIDAVEEGVTGLLYDAGNVTRLAELMNHLVSNPGLRKNLGEEARNRALRDYSQEGVTSALLDYYQTIIG